MCEVCNNVQELINRYVCEHDAGDKLPHTISLSKQDVLNIVNYPVAWSQRQCMCCYKDAKNYEIINNLVQNTLSVVIHILQDLSSPEGGAALIARSPSECSDLENNACAMTCQWYLAEIERLLAYTSAAFMINFPLYLAYKHHYHGSAEELSQQEAAILGTYCDVADADGVPVSIFRNVCFFCDSSGFQAILKCFNCCSTDILTIPLVHCIVSIVSNIRSWLIPTAVIQHIMPLKPAIVSFMCKLTDDELRMAGSRNMTDMLWAVLKEPTMPASSLPLTVRAAAATAAGAGVTFDSDALALAFKYFTSSTLTLRLAGIGQLNNHIAIYNDVAHVDSDSDNSAAAMLVQWLLENKMVEHIFGPNLHIEIIKQSQLVLNLLAAEGCLTEEHIDAIWQAALLKHCGRQVQDVLVMLIKNLALPHITRLACHLAALEPGAHTDHTLFLSSAVTKVLWTALSASSGREALSVPALLGDSTAARHRRRSLPPPLLVHDSSLEQDMTSTDESETSEEERQMSAGSRKRRCVPRTRVSAQARKIERARMLRRKRLHSQQQQHPPRHVATSLPGTSATSVALTVPPTSLLAAQEPTQQLAEGEALPLPALAPPSGETPLASQQPAVNPLDSEHVAQTSGAGSGAAALSDLPARVVPVEPGQQHVPATVEHFHAPLQSPRAAIAGGSSDNNGSASDVAAAVASDEDGDDDMLQSDTEDCDGLGPSAGIPAIFVAAAVAAAGRTTVNKPSNPRMLYKGKRPERSKMQADSRRAGASEDESMDSSCDLDEKFLDVISSVSGAANVEKVIAEISQGSSAADLVLPALASKKNTCMQQRPLQHGARSETGVVPPDLDDDDMEEDEENDSCASSQLSVKSEKNMADFEGEDFVSEEELSHIHRHSCSDGAISPSLGDQLGLRVDDVCLPGHTLLWDLIQDDKVHLLPEGLAFEAEKLLCNLLCYALLDKHLRLKFVEACIKNIAANRTVIVSLRLLPRLLTSFQQFRGSHMDPHSVTMWADADLDMMNVFFQNLVTFRQVLDEKGPEKASSVYGLKEDVRVRLHFLSSIYSLLGSPEKFQLTRDQVDIVWSCLATHPLTSDQCLSWFAAHAKTRCDFHALDFDSLKYLFAEKMSTLRPETVSMIGFNLYQQLHHAMQTVGLNRERGGSLCSASTTDLLPASQVCASQLWDIAIRAQNSDVSAAAVEYLNTCYIACGDLEKEEEFVSRCMGSLLEALQGVTTQGAVESSLLAIERGLHLLKTHLESFRQRYAYALRSWQLEAGGIASHQRASQDRGAPILRLVISAAGLSSFASISSDKVNVEVHSTDYLGEFRAEVTKWWQNVVSQHRKQQQSASTESTSAAPSSQSATQLEHAHSAGGSAQSPASIVSCLLGSSSSGPIRIITNGQELTSEHDSKTLAELQFKDGQTVFVSVYSGRQPKSRSGNDTAAAVVAASSWSAPAAVAAVSTGELSTRGKIPMLILLQQPHFDNLFNLLKQLSSPDQLPLIKDSDEATKSRTRALSRKVWDLLMMLPTNSTALRGLTSISSLWSSTLLPAAASWQSSSSFLVSSALGSCGDGQQQQPGCAPTVDWLKLLDASCAPKLLYCLQIVEALSQGTATGSGRRVLSLGASGRRRKSSAAACHRWPPAATLLASATQSPQRLVSAVCSHGGEAGSVEGSIVTESSEEAWSRQFVSCGGLRRLFDIFVSGCLQAREGEVWNEWSQEALAYLLRLMIQFATAPLDHDQAGPSDRRVPSGEPSGKKKAKKPKLDNVIVPVLNQELLPMLRCRQNEVLHILTTVVRDAAAVPCADTNEKNGSSVTAVWSRADVVHFALSFLVSWAYADSSVKDGLSSHPQYSSWVKSVTLEAPESEIRLEACRGLYRLCLGRSADGNVSGHVFLPAMLLLLLDHLPEAVRMKPPFVTAKRQPVSEMIKAKDGFYGGSTSSEYLWLLCRLVDGLACSPCAALNGSPVSAMDAPAMCAVTDRLDILCHSLSEFVAAREFYETRHSSSSEDDGLRCLLELMTAVLKHNPAFKFSANGQKLVEDVFSYLFALPTMQQRHLPKCKTHASRSAAYDVLVELAKGCGENYSILHRLLLEQHRKDAHAPYPWDYWPQEDVRSGSGYVGLTNLGATCYMATCMQHLFMIPQARQSLLQAQRSSVKEPYESTLAELQKMFAYLLESERKAYNPRSFCKVYMMHQQPLNTGEQKDMTEFFTDLIGKLEEMSPDLRKLVKGLFGGVLSNNVVSRDCSHISRTVEEFYTVRCQVADMKSLYESLDEICVKDILEGDNMYTCSQCQKKVRAEKRACFKKLPRILCFNTMRYTFNMLTMQKEKVNTHFSFPLQLSMADYMEKNLLKQCESSATSAECGTTGSSTDSNGDSGANVTTANGDSSEAEGEESSTEYELIGVTVHTGNADGGHYYSFIRDRLDRVPGKPDKWYLFNDAEVKPFDPAQLATECFGGEMTSKTYDSITEKFMDFSFEKTNSAYMLFYERISQPSLPSDKPVATENPVKGSESATSSIADASSCDNGSVSMSSTNFDVCLPDDLAEWIWGDNMEFLHDKNIFDSSYIGFMFQMCGYIPTTLAKCHAVTSASTQSLPTGMAHDVLNGYLTSAVQLATSFLLETFIHAKEKPNMVQWIELLIKQFNQCHEACEWFLRTMARDDWWPQQILISCPNQVVRQMFQRLVMHVVSQLRPNHCRYYLGENEQPARGSAPVAALSTPPSPAASSAMIVDDGGDGASLAAVTRPPPPADGALAALASTGGSSSSSADTVQQSLHPSVVAQFVAKMLRLLENRGCARQQQPQSHGSGGSSSSNGGKYMSEYFSLLFEISKLGDEEKHFLLSIGAISKMVAFYLGTVNDDTLVDIGSDDDDNDDFLPVPDNKLKVASLEKMIQLIAMLVESSRDECGELELSPKDRHSLTGGKGFPFIVSQIRDNINLKQTCNLIISLTRWEESLASEIVQAIFGAISRFGSLGSGGGDSAQPFFKLLTMLTEFAGAGPPGTPVYTHLVLQRIWEVIEHCAQPCLEWLATLVCRHTSPAAIVLQHLDSIVEPYLMAHSSPRVRNAASLLLVSLVPSSAFRQAARNTRSVLSPHKELTMTAEALHVLHIIYKHLLGLLVRAKSYVDVSTFGTTNLVAYFALLTLCLVSRAEKLVFTPYFMDLWHVYQPKMTEPPISINHNKQALLSFWYHVSIDCPENVKLITSNSSICKNIAFNYILADHEDQDIMMYNRCMLPSYYGLLRLCCQRSRPFTRQLAQHQNVQWALQHITPYANHYPLASEELFRMVQLMVTVYPDSTEEEIKAVQQFKLRTLHMYQQTLNSRSEWQTLLTVMKLLLEKDEERLQFVQLGGLPMCAEAFSSLHTMYHEATACHVVTDIVDLLNIMTRMMKLARQRGDPKDMKPVLAGWKERFDIARHCLSLLHSYAPPELRQASLDILRELVLIYNADVLPTIVSVLAVAHGHFQEASAGAAVSPPPAGVVSAYAHGPYFPRRGHKASAAELRLTVRAPRPQFGMFLSPVTLEAKKGVDPAYDQALNDFFVPYYLFVDLVLRVAVNQKYITESLVTLSAVVAYESAPLHAPYFPKLWCEIYCTETRNTELTDRSYIRMLCQSHYLIDYMNAILKEERTALNNQYIYQFFCNYFPKVHKQVLTDRREQGDAVVRSIIDSLRQVEALKPGMAAGKLEFDSADMQQMACRANGDIRALLIIYSVRPPAVAAVTTHASEPLGPVIMPPALQRCLDTIESLCELYQTQHKDREAAAAAAEEARDDSKPAMNEVSAEAAADAAACPHLPGNDDDEGTRPSKRRKIDEDVVGVRSVVEVIASEGQSCTSHGTEAPATDKETLPVAVVVPDNSSAEKALKSDAAGDNDEPQPGVSGSQASANGSNELDSTRVVDVAVPSTRSDASSSNGESDSDSSDDGGTAGMGSRFTTAEHRSQASLACCRDSIRSRASCRKPGPVDVIINSVKSLKDMFARLAATYTPAPS